MHGLANGCGESREKPPLFAARHAAKRVKARTHSQAGARSRIDLQGPSEAVPPRRPRHAPRETPGERTWGLGKRAATSRARVPHAIAFGAERLEEGWWSESKVLLGPLSYQLLTDESTAGETGLEQTHFPLGPVGRGHRRSSTGSCATAYRLI